MWLFARRQLDPSALLVALKPRSNRRVYEVINSPRMRGVRNLTNISRGQLLREALEGAVEEQRFRKWAGGWGLGGLFGSKREGSKGQGKGYQTSALSTHFMVIISRARAWALRKTLQTCYLSSKTS